jgi:hypothetical protein
MATSKKVQISTALATVALSLLTCLVGYKIYQHVKATRAAANPVVAIVNQTLIHKSDLSALSPPASSQEAIGLMVDFTLLDQAAQKKNITVSEAEMQQQRQQVISNQHVKTYAAAAKALGRTPAGLDLQLRHAALLYKLATLKFTSPVGRMFHARGILIKADGKQAKSEAEASAVAKKLQKQVAAGADIAALAHADSDDSLSAPSGGDLGIIQLAGAPNLVLFANDFKLQKALANGVKSAHAGTVMPGPIQGDLGYWVVKIISTSSNQLSDKSRYQQVENMWQQMWVGRLEPQEMASLRGTAEIQPPIATAPQQPVATAPAPPGARSLRPI